MGGAFSVRGQVIYCQKILTPSNQAKSNNKMLAEALSSATTAALWLTWTCPVNIGFIHTYCSVSCNPCAPLVWLCCPSIIAVASAKSYYDTSSEHCDVIANTTFEDGILKEHSSERRNERKNFITLPSLLDEEDIHEDFS